MVNSAIWEMSVLLKIAVIAAGVAFVLASGAEMLHIRRVRRIEKLVFGPQAQIPFFFRLGSVLRVAGLTMMVFGLTYLAGWFGRFEPKTGGDADTKLRHPHHVVFAHDVSPSMLFANDAGPVKNELRIRRSEALYRSVMERLRSENALYSVIAFWKDARIIVKDTPDLNILDNIFNGLPLSYALKSGGEKTSLPAALEQAALIAKEWPPESATLIFLTDGDVLPEKGLARLPSAYRTILIFGVGDPLKGAFIDDHYSRQSRSGLNDLASRYGGIYFDANELLPGSEFFTSVRGFEGLTQGKGFDLRALSVWLALGGSVLFALVTPFLTLWAGKWNRQLRAKGGSQG